MESVLLKSFTEVERLIAETEEDYVLKAKALAEDTERVIAYKFSLRNRLMKSPLGQHERFTAILEQLYAYLHEYHLGI